MDDMDTKQTMHITIQKGRSLPELERCTTCCNVFHCPFCSSTLFHSTKLSKVRTHLESHFSRAVLHEGYTIHRSRGRKDIRDESKEEEEKEEQEGLESPV
ncbi:hypothetical protein DPEC_G00310110 [Dallia pectoralis]|uniref:Uncharacterized protein n=1 Tax=Dallia pectoralis TaxID=75939 RepID=A0ACC2FF36_DALPE|nr:hypothetical protein DPEC_G00310110 [Dallia pectoralis]